MIFILIHFSKSSMKRMRECLRLYLPHLSSRIRRLAGKALIAFLVPSDTSSAAANLLAVSGRIGSILRIPSTTTPGEFFLNSGFSNSVSGQLSALKSWIRRAPTMHESAKRAKYVYF